MPRQIQGLMQQYVATIQKIYGSHLRQVILYGSYARGDCNKESDLDIMILLLSQLLIMQSLISLTISISQEHLL